MSTGRAVENTAHSKFSNTALFECYKFALFCMVTLVMINRHKDTRRKF